MNESLRQRTSKVIPILVLVALAVGAKCGPSDETLCAKITQQRLDAEQEKTVACIPAKYDPFKPANQRSLSERLALQSADEPCRLAVGAGGVCSTGGYAWEKSACTYGSDSAWTNSCTDSLFNIDKMRPAYATCLRACMKQSETLIQFNTCSGHC
jgi:hypothetical protein